MLGVASLGSDLEICGDVLLVAEMIGDIEYAISRADS